MPALKLAAAAAAGYVLTRIGWVFFELLGVVAVVLVLAAVIYAAWRRRAWPVAAGLATGAALSALALTI